VDCKETRAETFLKMYRVLEGLLERRYSGKKQGSSVVMDYIRDQDSEPWRYELDVCREIRNLLSHNADGQGEPVVEPSEAILESLRAIVEHVSRPLLAVECGTPCAKILCAHPNDRMADVMNRMEKLGYSHVPVVERGRLVGVFSAGCLFAYLEKYGLNALREDARIGQLQEMLSIDRRGADRYRFMPEDATILQVRSVFEERRERNHRLSAVFITKNGTGDEPLLAMLTPWDVMKASAQAE